MAGEIVVGLEVGPELGGRIERLRKRPGDLRRDSSLPMDDFSDSLPRYTNMLGEGSGGEPERLEELLLEDLAEMRRDSVLGGSMTSSFRLGAKIFFMSATMQQLRPTKHDRTT